MSKIDLQAVERLVQNPLWYLEIPQEMEGYLFDSADGHDEEWKVERDRLRFFLADLLLQGKIAVSHTGPNHDEDRQPVDTAVIHHTKLDTHRAEDVEVTDMLKLYLPEHRNPKRPYFQQPLWSGHFTPQGRQTFAAYHYLIWEDGRIENTLDPRYIGWHAGDWDINTRSVAIAFVGNFSDHAPSNLALSAAKDLILSSYPGVKVIGHNEIVQTTCPGNGFLGEEGWKKRLSV